jgi:beta-lactam-binding protein with PASTA domain/tRNA A-37 threonylcarbamoyl transferase component Bud32
MAEVYLARDLLLDRPVALKVLFPEFATDPSFVERFRREARAAANLNHPNIVSIYDWGAENGTYFIVMEYVEGPTLREVIRREGPLLAYRAAQLGSEIAAALHFAHVHECVHRDMKPGNVLIGGQGLVKVADFGIARAGDPSESLTQTGAVMGTATYFSPEQAQGQVVDRRSDVYSLGVVLYEMVTSKPPFTGDNPVSIAYQHVREDAVPPSERNPDVPRVFDAIVAKAMAKDREDRYATADALRADLVRFIQGRAVSAEPLLGGGVDDGITGMIGPTTRAGMAAVAGGSAATRMQQGVDGTRVVTGTLVDEERPRARTGTYIVILAAALAVVAGLLFLLSRQLGVGGAEQVPVPLVVGQDEAGARKLLEDAGLKVQRKDVTDEANRAGQVVDQDPKAGAQIDRGATVTISVSSGVPSVEVPDVRNRSLDAATDALRAVGLNVKPNPVNSDKPPNTVLEQDPAPGKQAPKGSDVTLTVSKGAAQVLVPNVGGRDAADAANQLGQLGFVTNSRTDNSNDVQAGRVIRTEPASGTPLDKGSVVTLIVSAGPVPTTPTTQATVPPTVATTQPPPITITLFPPPTTATTKPAVTTTAPKP